MLSDRVHGCNNNYAHRTVVRAQAELQGERKHSRPVEEGLAGEEQREVS